MTSPLTMSSLLEVCPHGAWVTEDVAIELLEGVESSKDLQRLHLEGQLPHVQVEHGSLVEAPSPYNKYRFFFVNSTKVTWPIVDLGDWLKICAKLSSFGCALEGSLTQEEEETIRKLCDISNIPNALESLRTVRAIISTQDLRHNKETTASAVSFNQDDDDVTSVEALDDEFHYGMATATSTNKANNTRPISVLAPKLPPELCVRSDSFGTRNNDESNIEMVQEDRIDEDESVSTTSSIPPLHTNLELSEADRDQDVFQRQSELLSSEISLLAPSMESKSEVAGSVVTSSSRIPKDPGQNKLSLEQDFVAKKYRKMLQMGIPMVAIEFGMAINGVNPDIVTSVLEQGPLDESSEHTTFSDHGRFVRNGSPLVEYDTIEEVYDYYQEEAEILLDMEEWDGSYFILEEEFTTDEDTEEIEVSTDEEWYEEETMTACSYDELMTIEETIAAFEEGEWTADEVEEEVYCVEEDVVILEGEYDDNEEEIVDSGFEVSPETIEAIEKVLSNRKNSTKYVILQGRNRDEKKKLIEELLATRKQLSTETVEPKLSKEEKKAVIEKVLAKRRQQANATLSIGLLHTANKATLEKIYARRRELTKAALPKQTSKEAQKATLETLFARRRQQANTTLAEVPSKEAKKAALEKLYRRRSGRNRKSVPHDASTEAKKAVLESLLIDQKERPSYMTSEAPNRALRKAALERFYARRHNSSQKAVPHDASTAAKIALLESFYAEARRNRPVNLTSGGTSTEAKKAELEKLFFKRQKDQKGVEQPVLNTRKISSSSVEEILARMTLSADGRIDIEAELMRKIQEAQEVQRKLEKQLTCCGVHIAEDIDYDVCMQRIPVIAKRMAEIGSAHVVHPNKKKQDELRLEYFKLEQDMAKYSNAMLYSDEYQEEQAKLNREWEAQNHEANVKALKCLRRHMPPNISQVGEAELLDEITPNGLVLPPHIARKMKRSNVLQLIRRNPDDIARMHPSVLTSMRTIGLTITERRAIYEHLRPIGPVLESLKGKGKSAEKYKWYAMMKENFKEKLTTYSRHIQQYGSPGKHQCPWNGRQCPVKHDQEYDYSGDYGWTDQPVYAALTPVAAPDKYDPVEIAKVAEFQSAQKAIQRDHALKEHYKANLRAVNEAKGSCNSMETMMRKMELGMEKWIEDRMNIEMRRLELSHDMKITEAASFNEILSECKLGIIGMCSRAGLQVSGKRKEAALFDPRSALECFLADEVKETFEIFARLVQQRMKRLQIVDQKIQSTIKTLSCMLMELQERNAKTVEALGASKGERSRILKTEEVIMKEVEDKKRAAEVAIIVGSIKREAKRKAKLRGETREFLFTLHKYLDCRRQMDAKYLEVDEFQIIAEFPINVDTPTGFSTDNQQQSVTGEPVKNLEELFEAANIAAPIFHDFIEGLIDKLCTRFNHDREGIRYVKADLKSKKRASDKAVHDYGEREPGPGISWLYDIIRGSIEFSSAQQVVQFVDLILKEEPIRVIKAKNRFSKPSLTGYRDLNIQFQVKTEHGFSHICEIQIHHSEILKLDKELKSHDYYEFFRAYFAGATDSLKERLDDLKLISQGGDLDDNLLNELLQRNKNERRLERLGNLFEFSLCEYHFALGVYGKLFEIRVKKHGPTHPLVSKTYTMMASVLQKQGKLEEAMELYRASQEINKRTHGERHQSVASTYEHMAMILKEQDKLDDAIKFFEKALEINQELYGEKHPSCANTYNNIAVVHQEQGNLDKAVELCKKSLDINTELFGGDTHWTIAGTYSNMALILMTQSKLDDAMKLYRRSLEIYRKTLGERHSDVAKAYFNMALVLKAQGNLDGAMKLYSKSLEIDKKNLGELHPSVAYTYQSMALILQDQGKHAEAIKMYDKFKFIERKLSFERSMASNMRRKMTDTRKMQNL